jgi:ssDNA thymidine ADP-ribosyltransferase, DarT
VRRDDLRGLHNAFHRANLQSYLRRGVLSHTLAENVAHRSIADAGVQERRARVRVPPDRRPLHTFANLYINVRNTVMYRFKRDLEDAGGHHRELVVIEVTTDVLDLAGVIVTDRNAAASPRWFRPDDGLAAIDRDDVFATYWNGQDHAQRMCAEVLVPDRVDPEFITRVYVSCDEAAEASRPICGDVPVEVWRRAFFL